LFFDGRQTGDGQLAETSAPFAVPIWAAVNVVLGSSRRFSPFEWQSPEPLGRTSRCRSVVYSAPALAGIWSLLTFYHLTYGFVLLLPTAMLLIFSTDSTAPLLRNATFWTLQLGLMIDVPGLWRRVGGWLDAPAFVAAVVPHFDRLLVTFVFVAIVALYVRSAGEECRSRDLITPV
jgi:hypothetical protein